MNSFDGSKKNEMDEILNFIYKMGKDRWLKHSDIYNVLCYYSLKESDKPKVRTDEFLIDGLDNEYFFPYWTERFKDKKNINVFVDPNWSYFIQFVNNASRQDEYIKLYIPIDDNHLYNGANMLFDFLERNNITHQSKISKRVRADNVIVRLHKNDKANAQRIIDFVNNTPYLKEGLNKPNPFIPTINGIGYMIEHGNSYNSDITDYIQEFINQARQKRKFRVSADEFREFLYDCKKKNLTFSQGVPDFDDSLLDTFEMAYSGKNRNLNANNQVQMDEQQKVKLLVDSLRATYLKYGIRQVVEALKEIIKYKSYVGITNGGQNELFRERLEKNVNPSDIVKIIDNMTVASRHAVYEDIDDKATIYSYGLFSNELPFALEDICKTTLEKRGISQVAYAIRLFLRNGNTMGFSRFRGDNFEVNYRAMMSAFTPKTLRETIKSSLSKRGLFDEKMSEDEMIDLYSSCLDKQNTLN